MMMHATNQRAPNCRPCHRVISESGSGKAFPDHFRLSAPASIISGRHEFQEPSQPHSKRPQWHLLRIIPLLCKVYSIQKVTRSRAGMPTWIVVGASRGIGLEWVRQLLARGNHVIATVRDVAKASQLWALAGAADRGSCQLFECDVNHEASIIVCATGVFLLRHS